MARWLFKNEPDCYSFADLERDGETVWDGVTNALALKHLRAAKPGDKVFLYHTGDEKSVIGVMEVTAAVDPDADAPALRVKAVRRLPHPVPLAVVKADPAFDGWELVRIARLSVMPVSDAMWKRVEELAKAPAVLPPKAGGKAKKAAG